MYNYAEKYITQLKKMKKDITTKLIKLKKIEQIKIFQN